MTDLAELIGNPRCPVVIERSEAGYLARSGELRATSAEQVVGLLPPIYPEWLGDRAFIELHGSRFAYVVGEMARGISTPRMVAAAVRAGLVGFFGSAGLQPPEIDDGLREIQSALGTDGSAWGANLIYSPQQPGYEAAVVDLLLARGVRRLSASAYMRLSPEVVRYAALGLTRDAAGEQQRSTHVFAKVSRAEVAAQFMAPPPEAMLRDLVASGKISTEQATLAARLPVSEDITAESDSGGHTDNRPSTVLFPSLVRARKEVCVQHDLDINRIRIGLAGGIATPAAAAAAFQMGAAYVLTGSVNQSAVESGLSALGRAALAEAGPADVAMTPAADMFEQGVRVQVLKRGTLFAARGQKMAELYQNRAGIHDLSRDEVAWLEKVLGEPVEVAWQATREYLARANPSELSAAEQDPRKQMALLFRRYLFMGAEWARRGVPERKGDFQIWCGPAMGAFNEWVRGSFLEAVENRTVKQIAWNLMEGAASLTRAVQLQSSGVAVPPALFDVRPKQFA